MSQSTSTLSYRFLLYSVNENYLFEVENSSVLFGTVIHNDYHLIVFPSQWGTTHIKKLTY